MKTTSTRTNRKHYIISAFDENKNIEDVQTKNLEHAQATTRYWMAIDRCHSITVCMPIVDGVSTMHQWTRGEGWQTISIGAKKP